MRHFIEELEDLRGKLLEMCGLVEDAVHRSIRCLVERDEEQAQQVLANESRVNRMEIEIDDMARRLLTLQQPMASDMRFLTAAIKINNDLERMGDLAVHIVQRALALMQRPLVKPLIDIPHMATLVQSMVRKSIDSFVRRDADLARSVLTSDDAVDELRDAIYDELVNLMMKDPEKVRGCIDLIFIARNLERIADHATNIAEDVLFLVQGVEVRHHAESHV